MSINTEYEKYCSCGGTLTETRYDIHLNHLKTTIGVLINSDPKDKASDIGRRIFKHLGLPDAIVFSQVSKGLNARSKNRWFVTQSKEIVLKYVQQKTTYIDFLKNGGWRDLVVGGAKVAGVAITVSAGVKASIHASRIPLDAPNKTITVKDLEGTKYEVTVVDHPEARKSEAWTFISASVGTITILGIVGHGLYRLLKDMDLDIFFSASEKEILGSAKTNLGLKIVSPNFHEWKVTKIRENLTSNPPNWKGDRVLSRMVCPISGDFMLFPVKDKCGHYFDYRSVRGYQLNPATKNPLECPVSRQKPNTGLTRVQFDKAKFDRIQRLI